MARLRTHVHVTDDQGQSHVYGPTDEVPVWAQKRITNRKAWDEAPEADSGESGGSTSSNGEPPRSGKGSSKEAWAAYAAEHDVEVPEDASRESIIAELEQRGVIKPVTPPAE